MGPPRDTFSRPLASLRLSVTDRCNLRCAYCMPEEDYSWLPTREILRFEELSSVVDAFLALGVRKLRLTGGEPLVRRDLSALVALLAQKSLDDLALTTNGVRLEAQAESLRQAGLHRLTVSLDTLSPQRFLQLTRRDDHAAVLRGIQAARAAAFPGGLKLDTVVMRGLNDDELLPLLDYAATVGAELRFIEYMDVGGATRWAKDRVLSRADLLRRLEDALGPAQHLPEPGSTAPAERFRLGDGRIFGIIASTTAPFCSTCDRARVTADGRWFTCLYAQTGLDLKTPLRAGASTAELAELIASAWERRKDRGAEERLARGAARTALAPAELLRGNPHLEMHTRGG